MLKKNKLEEKRPTHTINWYEDKFQSVLVWRNLLFVVTIASLIGVVAVCGVLFITMPLKSVAPFVIQVDEKSGLSTVVSEKGLKEYSANEMVLKYFTMQYISARESYDLQSFKPSLEVVRVMSAKDVYWGYAQATNQSNPASPLNIYADHTNRDVGLISFSILSKNETSGESIVQARIRVKEIRSNSRPSAYYAVVTLSCYFEENLQLNEKERLINPLGFIVSSYKSDQEIQGEQK
jgi:type IV secretion system protein VirB8